MLHLLSLLFISYVVVFLKRSVQLKNSEQKVKEYLDLFKGCTSVSAVAPFVGEILDIEELRVKELQKSDMKFALEPFYGMTATAVSKLSSKVGKTESELLINTLKGLLKKYPKS